MSKRMEGFIIGLIIGIIFGFAVTFGVFHFLYIPTYTANNLELTQSQYQEFKSAVIQDNVQVNQLSVMDSTPPIVVTFDIQTNDNFPFGNKEDTESINIFMFIFIPVTLGIIFGMSGMAIQKTSGN